MPGAREYAIRVLWDQETGVWFVESSDIPGLNVETPSLDELVEVVRDAAPDLIEHNLPAGAAGESSGYILNIQHVVTAPRLSAA